MPSIRTQVYLTAEQRRRLDELTRVQARPMAEIFRDALDAYLVDPVNDPASALEATFGAIPDLSVPPRDEWDRG